MTTVKMITTNHNNPALIINGRQVLVNRITEIANTNASWEWVGKAGGYDFRIFGGKASGGSANEWFVEWAALGEDTMNATSFTECVKIIENS